jgi:hypothetical protein
MSNPNLKILLLSAQRILLKKHLNTKDTKSTKGKGKRLTAKVRPSKNGGRRTQREKRLNTKDTTYAKAKKHPYFKQAVLVHGAKENNDATSELRFAAFISPITMEVICPLERTKKFVGKPVT